MIVEVFAEQTIKHKHWLILIYQIEVFKYGRLNFGAIYQGGCRLFKSPVLVGGSSPIELPSTEAVYHLRSASLSNHCQNVTNRRSERFCSASIFLVVQKFKERCVTLGYNVSIMSVLPIFGQFHQRLVPFLFATLVKDI